ncbi:MULTISPECIES: hypothetical protein [Acinetobacter]|jgi:hypothetical protein|uniref:Uncharacterized protein n=1 Tax=Acinetobacter johnsonii TaxID=40214 RepID=A0AA42SPJ7_ACIJO|nr:MULTISPECIES: hypothetical protein [Acinetobacter]MBP6437138.1 hypothetical protein [Paludibacteraceae bacterium]MDN5623464.1 hypothetical protein [Acinetobacter sp.]MDN5651666.1 hypothetical protein [Lactococcus lactis]MDH0969497.1 hypothetical protein [Acinetobacter johnsonii]MDN5691569.1 hypothetical protein [Acinetobacter sp.]
MSELEYPAAKAAKALNNYIEHIGNAIVFNNAIVPVTDDNEYLIKVLNKAELGYFNTEKNGFNLYNHVISFVTYYEKKRRVTDSSKQIHKLISDIRANISEFETTKLKSVEDAEIYKDEISEGIVELANTIFESCYDFSTQALQDLALFNNLEVRIQRIEKTIRILSSLTEVMGALSTNAMLELGASDKDLESLVVNKLIPVFIICSKEVKYSASKLNKQLFDWKQELSSQKKSNMVDAFHRFLKGKSTLNLEFDEATASEVFYHVPCSELISYADLDADEEQEMLRELGSKVFAKREKRIEQNKNQENLPDVREGSEVVEQPLTALEIATSNFFDALLVDGGKHQQLSGVETYELLMPGCDIDFWLIALTSHYRNRFKDKLNMEFVETIDPIFDGNSCVSDVIISRTDKLQQIA